MIQRIQSIYLFLAALFMGGLFLNSADLININTTTPSALSDMEYLNDTILDIYDQNIMVVLALVTILFALLAIFLFKRRKVQIALSRVGMLVALFFLVFSFYLAYADLGPFISSINIVPDFGLFLPVAVIVFLILAQRGIRKDDNLVKSMDRLR